LCIEQETSKTWFCLVSRFWRQKQNCVLHATFSICPQFLIDKSLVYNCFYSKLNHGGLKIPTQLRYRHFLKCTKFPPRIRNLESFSILPAKWSTRVCWFSTVIQLHNYRYSVLGWIRNFAIRKLAIKITFAKVLYYFAKFRRRLSWNFMKLNGMYLKKKKNEGYLNKLLIFPWFSHFRENWKIHFRLKHISNSKGRVQNQLRQIIFLPLKCQRCGVNPDRVQNQMRQLLIRYNVTNLLPENLAILLVAKFCNIYLRKFAKLSLRNFAK
jgi:hypothetical protein